MYYDRQAYFTQFDINSASDMKDFLKHKLYQFDSHFDEDDIQEITKMRKEMLKIFKNDGLLAVGKALEEHKSVCCQKIKVFWADQGISQVLNFFRKY